MTQSADVLTDQGLVTQSAMVLFVNISVGNDLSSSKPSIELVLTYHFYHNRGHTSFVGGNDNYHMFYIC